MHSSQNVLGAMNSVSSLNNNTQSPLPLFSQASFCLTSGDVSLSLRKLVLQRHKLLQALHKCFSPFTLSMRMAAVFSHHDRQQSQQQQQNPSFKATLAKNLTMSPEQQRQDSSNSPTNTTSNSHRDVFVTPMSFLPQKIITKHVANLYYPFLREANTKQSEYDVSGIDETDVKLSTRKRKLDGDVEKISQEQAHHRRIRQTLFSSSNNHFSTTHVAHPMQDDVNRLLGINISKQQNQQQNLTTTTMNLKFDFSQFLSESIQNAQEFVTATASALGANAILSFRVQIHEIDNDHNNSTAYVLFSLSGDAVITKSI